MEICPQDNAEEEGYYMLLTIATIEGFYPFHIKGNNSLSKMNAEHKHHSMINTKSANIHNRKIEFLPTTSSSSASTTSSTTTS